MSRQAWQGRGFTTSRLHEETGLHQSGLNLLAGLRNYFNSGDQPAIEEPFKLHRKVGMWHMSHLLTIIVEGANKCRRIVTGNLWKSYMCTAVKKWDTSDPRSYEHFWISSWNETWKKFRCERDLNPWLLRYRCSALPTELLNWEKGVLIVLIFDLVYGFTLHVPC